MAWSEAHDELLNHPKTAALSASMGWNKFETVGRLMAFWWWVLKYAPTGDLRKPGFNNNVLGAAVELNGEAAERWVRGLVEARWLDKAEGCFRVHDWPHYTRRYLKNSRFNGRPDKWQEVLDIYPEFAAMEQSVVLDSDPRASSRVTRLTNPTQSTHSTKPPRQRRSGGEKVNKKTEIEQRLLEEIANEQRSAASTHCHALAVAGAGGADGK